MDEPRVTPAMEQFYTNKKLYPDCVIFFRMGDFYEMFNEDAEITARELNITLTQRGGVPLAGIPYQSLEQYLPKMMNKGYKIAICEQVENPKLAKGRVVKREVVKVITPGTITIPSLLDQSTNNYIMSITKEGQYGIALADISTGLFIATTVPTFAQVQHEITRFEPAEIIYPKDLKLPSDTSTAHATPYEDRVFSFHYSHSLLLNHFGVLNLEPFGFENNPLAVSAAGGLMAYLRETQKGHLSQITKIQQFKQADFMTLDKSTIRNLELFRNIRDQTDRGTLFFALNETATPMGSRLLRQWLQQPLLNQQEINKRLDAVQSITSSSFHRESVRSSLQKCYDIERLITKVVTRSANARDLIALSATLQQLPLIKQYLTQFSSELINNIKTLPEKTNHISLIKSAILDDPRTRINEGGIIKAGYNPELDELKEITSQGKGWITALEEKERQITGISTLKIGFNRVHGYYIEIPRRHAEKMPPNYIRKQTIKNSERYITEELKQKEEKILTAEERMIELEMEIFLSILDIIAKDVKDYQQISTAIATLDTLTTFAAIAKKRNYIRPSFNTNNSIIMTGSRHPVVEIITKEQFIPNDIKMDNSTSMMIITGPNMAGKSTVMRQVALIQLLAQIGSFVPATQANLPIMNRIFTRVGAYDDLTMGQSTFMVEMTETANILNNADEKSLIIVDEIGRGTSTYDGIAIASSVAEFLHSKIKAKTLFATHYHQLNNLANQNAGIKNYNIAVLEKGDSIIFLRKLVEGGTDKSYGIQVAKIAGLPKEVIENAKKTMTQLETNDTIGARIHAPLKTIKVEVENNKNPQQSLDYFLQE